MMDPFVRLPANCFRASKSRGSQDGAARDKQRKQEKKPHGKKVEGKLLSSAITETKGEVQFKVQTKAKLPLI